MFDYSLVDRISISSLIGQATDKAKDAVQSVPWYLTETFLVLVGLVAILTASVLVGNMMARKFRAEDYGWKIALIFATFFSSILLAAVLFPPKFGVDLRGGMTYIGLLKDQNDLLPGEVPIEAKDIIGRLMQRVDPSGVKEIRIRALGPSQIEVTIPDVDIEEADRIWIRLTKTGRLLFRIVADEKHLPLSGRAVDLIKNGITDQLVRKATVGDPLDNKSGEIIGKWYNIAREASEDSTDKNAPFKLAPMRTHLVRNSKTKELLEAPTGDPVYLAKWCEENGVPGIEILMVEPSGVDDDANVEGRHMQSASKGFDESGRPSINFAMKPEGAQRLGYLTKINEPTGNHRALLGIVVDDSLISAPTINEVITTRGRITGSFTDDEVEDMVVNLRSGKIEVALNEEPDSQGFVQPSLGEELKQKGLGAIGISFTLVIVFMLFYYRFSGIVACFALVSNLLYIMVLMMLIKQPLTMTGLAGLVLTVGMSVDANVLIFERIREELRRGSALRMAIRNGFDRATTTIVDANLTTLITALVLYLIGQEQIKGFSVTLILGILMSMFTAIFCSRVIFELGERRRWITKLGMMRIFEKTQFDFIGKRQIAFTVSIILILVGIGATYMRGKTMLDHDLGGGSTAHIVLVENSGMDVEDVRAALRKYKDPGLEGEISFDVAQFGTDGRTFKINSSLRKWEGEGPSPYKELKEALSSVFGDKMEKRSLVYQPDKIQIQRLDKPVESSNSGEVPANSNSQLQWAPGASFTSMALQSLTYMVQDEGNEAKQDEKPGQQEPAAEKKEPAEGEAGKVEAAAQDDKSKVENKQDDKTQDDKTQDTAEAGDKSGDKSGEQDEPKTEAPDDAKDGSDETGNQDLASVIGDFEAKVTLNFGQPMSRRGLIDAILSAAETQGGISVLEDDIVVSADGVEPDSKSGVSTQWDVTLKLSKSDDAAKILSEFKNSYDGLPYIPVSSEASGFLAGQTRLKAIGAVIASLLGIVAYIWIRFQNVAFGLAAVIALVHDVLVVLGAVAVSYWLQGAFGILMIENFKISLPVVAAFLTIIGYSLNDTIVVFDRIREVRGKRTDLTREMINTSISQTLGRTILTSFTTFLVVFILFVLGGDAIHGFAFALVVGVVVGTYSSIFVASPALLWLMNRSAKVAPTEA